MKGCLYVITAYNRIPQNNNLEMKPFKVPLPCMCNNVKPHNYLVSVALYLYVLE